MTAAQTQLYFREWGMVRDHYRRQGIDSAQCEAKRHQLHKRALGVMKSSKDFTNADLDLVLAEFRAITQPGNLYAQMSALEGPERRLAMMRCTCRDLVGRIPKIAAAKNPDTYAANYLNSMARSLAGCDFADLDEKQVARVLGILRHRFGAARPAPAAVDPDTVPF